MSLRHNIFYLKKKYVYVKWLNLIINGHKVASKVQFYYENISGYGHRDKYKYI